MMRENPAIAKRAIAKRMQTRDEKELEDSYQLLRSFIQVKPYPTLRGSKLFSLTSLKEFRPPKMPTQKIMWIHVSSMSWTVRGLSTNYIVSDGKRYRE